MRERRLAKTKIIEMEDGFKHAAVAVGTALAGLAHKVGLEKVAAAVAPKAKKKATKKAAKKAVPRKSPGSKKKAAPTKRALPKKAVVATKVGIKKVAAKRKWEV